ncbi:MAG: hypothetical protein MJZ02_08645 [Paludibacteraceae bacterium]|nr:hypothetical protein [Paludibacteraceae bacterium]
MINPQTTENILNVLKQELNKIIPEVLAEGKKTLGEIKADTSAAFQSFIESIKTNTPSYMVFKEIDLLDSQTLVTLAKENKVDGANEVYAWRMQKDDALYVYLAYGKDKELIEKEQNKFVVVKTGALKIDVINLFKDSELVILK